jgi:hypothetical protein
MMRIVKLALLLALVMSCSFNLFAQSLPSTVVAYTGQTIPVVGGTYGTLGAFPRLGSAGHVAFSSVFAGAPNPDDFGYFVGLPGSPQLAIREDSDGGGPELFDGTGSVGVDGKGKLSVWTSLAFPVSINENQVLYGNMPGGTPIAKEGTTTAPGFAGGVIAAIGSGHASNDNGYVSFVGSATGGDAIASSDFALFASSFDGLSLVAREGTPAPGATGTTPVFSTFYDKRINDSRQVGFAAGLSGAGVNAINDRAVYVWTPGEEESGSLALVAQTGSHAPGTTASTTFLQLDDMPSFNSSGEVAFRGQLIGADIGFTNNFGIWKGTPGNLELVVQSAATSPIAGAQFRTPQPGPRINDDGDVAFFSNIAGGGSTESNNFVLWLASDDGIAPVAREGTPAPGTSSGVNFGSMDTTVALNNLGQVAFTSPLLGTGITSNNDRGLWAGTPDALQLIAREGDVIDLDPGPGTLLKTISGTNGISFAKGYAATFDGSSATAALNDLGQLVWRATFTDSTTAIMLSELPIVNPDPNADFDDDGDIDGRDFLIWQRGFGLTGQDDNSLGDADFSGTVDGEDLVIWQDQYGSVPPLVATVAVPEPGAILLLLPGVFAICTGRCGIRA